MSITVLVNGNPVNVIEGSLRLSDRTNQRRSYQFVIRDDAGTALYKKGQPVTFNDSVLGTVYSGFLNAPKANNLTPNTTNLWACDTVDMLWLGDKRSSNSVYTNQYSGVIVGDQVQNILSGEGVWANLALDYNHLLTDWTAGGATLAGVQAASNAGGGNPGDGDLELALAGSTVTKSELTTSDFSGGTLTNVQAASNALTLSTMPTIKLTGTCSGNPSSNINYTIWTGNYTIATGDVLYYTMWIDGSSANQIAFVHGHCSNGGNTGGIVDEQFLTETDGRVKDFASNQWYFRTVGLDVLAGSNLTNVWAGLTGSTSGIDTAYFHSIKIINGLTTKLTIFNSSLNANSLTHLYGYSGVSMTTTTSYYPASGSRISPSTSLAPVGILQAGRISWDANVPAGTSLTISTSVSGGATWTPQTNSSAIANLLAGADATGLTLQTKEELAITGNDPTVTPSLSSLQCVIRPSYAATKSDVRYSKYTMSDFNAGTLTNLIASSDANLTLNGVWRNWQSGLYPNQTLYGGGSPSQQVEDGSLRLSCASISDVRSRFDFAGQWNVLDMVITVDIPTADNLTNCGLVYGTSNWGNSNDSYAYAASISGTQLLLAKGTNSSGAGSFTSLATFNFTATLTQGSRHTLRVQWNGTGSTMNGIPAHTHNIYMDGVLYISQVDASYIAVGYIGARLFNTSGSPQVGHFDNFAAVISFANTTWVSPNYSLNSVGTCGNSLILWNAIVPNPSTIMVETSIDGMSTWQTATNGGQIVGLTDGVSLVGKNLNVRITFTESPGNETVFQGFTCWVMSHYSSSGTWTSPALLLTGVGRAGASLVNWNANTPTNTGLVVKTSVDNGSSYQTISTPGSPIPNLIVAPSPWVDVFPIDDHTVYTSTFYGSGVNGTWTWDTANKRLVGSGGTNAVLQYGGASLYGSAIYGVSYYGADPHFTQQDMDVIADFNWSDGGGLFTRMTDANHLYYVVVNDASASSNPNTLRLFKYISGTVTQLGTTQTIVFTRGSYVRIKLDAQGSALTVSLNGTQLISVTDSSVTGAGVSGFLCGTKIQAYSLRIQPYGQSLAGLSVFTQLTLTSTDPTVTPQVLDTSTFVSDGSVQAGNKISAADYRDTIVSANIDNENKNSNGWWTILASKQLIFQPQIATPAPWCLQSVADPNAANIQVAGLSMENSGDLYRNRQKLKGVNSTQSYDKQFTGDGKATSWTLDYKVAANTTPTIKLNGVVQTVGVQGVDTGKAFYYTPGNTSIQQDASGTTLQDIDTLEIDYLGSTTVTVTRNNTGQFPGTVSQAAYKLIDSTSGIVEQVLDVSQMNMDVSTAQQYGDQLLQRYGVIGRIFTFMTLMSGLAIGQQLPIFLPCFSANNVQALVTQVDVTERITGSGIQYWWNCVATEGPALDSWSKVLAGAID